MAGYSAERRDSWWAVTREVQRAAKTAAPKDQQTVGQRADLKELMSAGETAFQRAESTADTTAMCLADSKVWR